MTSCLVVFSLTTSLFRCLSENWKNAILFSFSGELRDLFFNNKFSVIELFINTSLTCFEVNYGDYSGGLLSELELRSMD